MKIAVLEKEGRVFSQCDETTQAAIVEVDPVSHTVRQTVFLTPPPPIAGILAKWLRQQDVEVVLTNAIRQRDRDLIEQEGMRVVVGVPPFRIEPVVARFLAGTLQTGSNPCEQPVGGRE